MIKRLNIIILICSCIFTFHACQKHMLEVKEWAPEMITPLINATVTIGDLIPERGTTEHDDLDSLIHLAFSSDTIYVLPPDLLLGLVDLDLDYSFILETLLEPYADNSLISLEFPFPDTQPFPSWALWFAIEQEIFDLDFLEDPFSTTFETDSVMINSADLSLEITNNLPLAIASLELKVKFNNTIDLDFNMSEIATGSSSSYQDSLTNLSLGEENTIEVSVLTLDFVQPPQSEIGVVTPESGLFISLSVLDVDLTLPLGRDTVDVDLALFEDFDSGLKLEHPTFIIKIDNPFDLEGSIYGDIDAFSEDGANSSSLAIQVDIIPEADNARTYQDDDIADIIELPPNVLIYESKADINFEPSDMTGITDSLKLGVDVDFPLSVDAANLSLKDTIPFNGIDYDITQIERMFLHYNLVNGFPLGTKFNLVLHDSLNPMENLDTLQFVGINNSNDNIIAAAEVNNEGKVIADVVTSGVLALSYSEINNLLNANKIIIDVTLSSSDSDDLSETYVKIYTYNKCVLKVGVETQINID